ncbi:MAG: hypothetical protein QOJ03_2357 [Frankiaceae bacterium]|jgi:uncharacterized protein YlxW (UPF0749 family)|nr:hypothetical protein [Frankiaceae bacterium]
MAIAALCGLLAFGLVTQVHATSTTGGLSSARTDDLLGILADLDNRADRLRADITDLQASDLALRSGTGQNRAALREARARARTLGILTGTLPASGPGIVLTISDPQGQVRADVLVDALQELRDAGAEAIQLSGVRVVASTALLDDVGGGVDVSGRRVTPPYRLAVIGDSRTLAGALEIPGGVSDTVGRVPGAHAEITLSARVTITALQVLQEPRYARPVRR